ARKPRSRLAWRPERCSGRQASRLRMSAATTLPPDLAVSGLVRGGQPPVDRCTPEDRRRSPAHRTLPRPPPPPPPPDPALAGPVRGGQPPVDRCTPEDRRRRPAQ